MSEKTNQSRPTAFNVGWAILFMISLLGLISQSMLILVEPRLVDSFIAWATFLLYSVFVLVIPYRRVERWAWYITWVLVIPYTVLGLNNPDAAPYFWSAAGLVAVCQVLTRSAFFATS